MYGKRQKPDIYAHMAGAETAKTKLHRVAKRRRTQKLKLNGNVARRGSLCLGITWDIELPGFGLRKRENGTVTWVVKYRYRGQQRMKTLGAARTINAHAARSEARRLIAEAALVGLPQKPKKKHVPKFENYVDEFWRDYAQHWKALTRKSCRGYIARELVPVFGKMQIDQIVRTDINRWRDSLSQRTGVFNRTIPLLSVMMRYAEQLGYRRKGTNPCRGISRYKRDLPERYFVQIPRLILPDSKTGPKTIYLNRQAMAVLESLERGKPDDYVFTAGRSNNHLRFSQYWNKVRKQAALPDVRLHDLRHSFASTAIADGVPLAIIGKLLGHALPESTARYAHLADDVISESAERVCSGLASAMGITHDQL